MTREPEFERFCIFCGKPFMTSWSTPYQENCSIKCQARSWRSRVKLAGTHGYVNGQWQRLPKPK